MKPIEIKIHGETAQSPQEICQEVLTLERWPEFEGYAFLPGIKEARFETRTPGWVGTRIRVQNRDGSSHIEEIIRWDAKGLSLKFQEFQPPVSHLATHFIETWDFSPIPAGTRITRRMTLFPKNWPGWLLLLPIAHLMKKAFEKQQTR